MFNIENADDVLVRVRDRVTPPVMPTKKPNDPEVPIYDDSYYKKASSASTEQNLPSKIDANAQQTLTLSDAAIKAVYTRRFNLNPERYCSFPQPAQYLLWELQAEYLRRNLKQATDKLSQTPTVENNTQTQQTTETTVIPQEEKQKPDQTKTEQSLSPISDDTPPTEEQLYSYNLPPPPPIPTDNPDLTIQEEELTTTSTTENSTQSQNQQNLPSDTTTQQAQSPATKPIVPIYAIPQAIITPQVPMLPSVPDYDSNTLELLGDHGLTDEEIIRKYGVKSPETESSTAEQVSSPGNTPVSTSLDNQPGEGEESKKSTPIIIAVLLFLLRLFSFPFRICFSSKSDDEEPNTASDTAPVVEPQKLSPENKKSTAREFFPGKKWQGDYLNLLAENNDLRGEGSEFWYISDYATPQALFDDIRNKRFFFSPCEIIKLDFLFNRFSYDSSDDKIISDKIDPNGLEDFNKNREHQSQFSVNPLALNHILYKSLEDIKKWEEFSSLNTEDWNEVKNMVFLALHARMTTFLPPKFNFRHTIVEAATPVTYFTLYALAKAVFKVLSRKDPNNDIKNKGALFKVIRELQGKEYFKLLPYSERGSKCQILSPCKPDLSTTQQNALDQENLNCRCQSMSNYNAREIKYVDGIFENLGGCKADKRDNELSAAAGNPTPTYNTTATTF